MDQAVHDLATRPAAVPRSRGNLRIVIVGAGFGGIGLAILLRQAGFSAITLFERRPGVGGTWRDNTYPGAACDVRSHLYSLSFAPNPDWPESFSGQKDILAYIEGVAQRFGVAPLVRCNTGVVRAAFDDARQVWRVETTDGATHECDIFIPAVGQLSKPVIPDFAGRADFAGASFHSAAWDHSVELAGKRVALVGSAASAVQILPEITRAAAHVDVFQRTPNWLLPRNNHAYAAWQKWLFHHVPPSRLALRLYIYLYGEFLYDAFRTGSWRNRLLKNMSLKHLGAQVHDPGLREKMVPRYEIGCKRVLFTDDYYPCFNQEHVALVTEPIDHFEAAGISTRDGVLHEADMVVFATGFDVTNSLRPVEIVGRGGLDLQAAWAQGPEAYRGIAVPHFPNLMMLYGPNTNLGHNSIIVMLEAQSRYIVQCLEHMVERNLATLEVSEPATRSYNEWIQVQLGKMVWSTGCGSWYTTGGRITANWSGSTLEYRRQMRRVVFSDFVETVAA
jgi:cation diffusion facilitator CzcD-associated flavoprotein CzcO